MSEAEDIVQEAFLRYHRAVGEGAEIASPKAYLSAIATRLSIDHLRSARARRETYVGPWLPEPLLADASPGPGEHAETADSLSLAFLVVLETLSPLERAVFLLREVFGYPYADIAEQVGKTEANCRQLAARARRRVEDRRPRFEVSRRRHEELTERFLEACRTGDAEGLLALLAADVVAYADGGGRAQAARRPIYGREKVARFMLGITRPGRGIDEVTIEPAEVNGLPGRVIRDRDGRPIAVLSLDVADGLVQAVQLVVNPDKLRHVA